MKKLKLIIPLLILSIGWFLPTIILAKQHGYVNDIFSVIGLIILLVLIAFLSIYSIALYLYKEDENKKNQTNTNLN